MYKELWINIDGTEYDVSNFGNVRNNYGDNVKGNFNKRGDRYVWIKNIGTKRVNRLVAEHFIPNPLNLPQVNHKDENPLNNDASNLEWCTAEYNLNYGTRTKRQVDTRKNNGTYSAPRKGRAVVGIHVETGEIVHYSAMRHGEKDGFLTYGIRDCANGISHTYKRHTWHYVDDSSISEIYNEEMKRRRINKLDSIINTNIDNTVNSICLNVYDSDFNIDFKNYESVRHFIIKYSEYLYLKNIIEERIFLDESTCNREHLNIINLYLDINIRKLNSIICSAKIKKGNKELLNRLINGESVRKISKTDMLYENTIYNKIRRIVKKINEYSN